MLRDIRVVEVIDHSTPVSIADGSQPSRQITQHGHETGWPRWSPDGKWLVYPSHVNDRPKARIYVVGMDQETGTVTRPQQEVPLGGAVF